VGFFDELQCSKILHLCALHLPGTYAVQSASCDLLNQLVLFTITRATKRQKVAALQPAPPTGTDAELLRLRTVHDVKEGDAPAVQQAIHAVTHAFDHPHEWSLVKCAQRTSLYVLYLKIHAKEVPYGTIRAAALHNGVVDFDARQVIIMCDKKCSDIV